MRRNLKTKTGAPSQSPPHTHTVLFSGTSCDRLQPSSHSPRWRRQHTVTWILHHGCLTVNTSSSRYKKITGLKWERREKQGLSLAFWKHQGGTMKWVGKADLMGKNIAFPLTHPSAEPNYTATTGVSHLRLSSLKVRSSIKCSTGSDLKDHLIQPSFYR